MRWVMRKQRFSMIRMICLAVVVGLGFLLLGGCGDDDNESISDTGSGIIHIQNYDNHDYEVELRLVADDSLVGTLDVDEFDLISNDWTASFEDVPEGLYYLIVLHDGFEIDRSSNFSIDEDDSDCYQIDRDGDLEDC